jgi:predicted naringenin-chalcone synthase
MYLSDFFIERPEYETEQAKTLDWIFAAHMKAEETKQGNSWHPTEKEAFRAKLKESIARVACKPDRVQKRGHILKDYLHQDWQNMLVYNLEADPAGANLGERLKVYGQSADTIFERFYTDASNPPDDLIHVTCTGYVAPSAAQKIVAKKGWGDQTTVTHAYHMGCYGAISALRMAKGFLASQKTRSDIIHTELCSLHINPSLHSSDQLVAQSLFADGFIKYSMYAAKNKPSLKVLNIHEKVIPNSTEAMTWNLSEWGFEIALAKEVPVLIARALNDYLEHLCKKAGLDPKKIIPAAHFAIHPGGPKILQHIQDLLSLKDTQIEKSSSILKSYGNMSSATLPHIWKAVLEDATIPSGTWIVSLAFGPGLSICGALLQKEY